MHGTGLGLLLLDLLCKYKSGRFLIARWWWNASNSCSSAPYIKYIIIVRIGRVIFIPDLDQNIAVYLGGMFPSGFSDSIM
jgi:hypothetical protein